MPRNLISNEGRLVNGNYRGQMTLAAGTTLTYGADDTYEKVVGNWSDGTLNYFTVWQYAVGEIDKIAFYQYDRV